LEHPQFRWDGSTGRAEPKPRPAIVELPDHIPLNVGAIDTTSMLPISLLRIELSEAFGNTLVQFMAFFEEFPLDTMHRVICTSNGKLEAEAFATVKKLGASHVALV